MDWERIQRERLKSIDYWYHDNYQADISPVIQYMVLWAVFNALYNLAYLPKRRVTNIREEYGHRIPTIWYTKEKEILRKFAIHLSKQDELVSGSLMDDNLQYLTEFSRRIPNVDQPAERITVEIKDEKHAFEVAEFRGIASIDKRFYQDDGSIIYQYAPFDLDLDEDGAPIDRKKLLKQLIFFLYQLRNNIVHGGSASIQTKELIAKQAQPVLETIVDYIFAHEELVITAAQ
jgi:hypothetical protein